MALSADRRSNKDGGHMALTARVCLMGLYLFQGDQPIAHFLSSSSLLPVIPFSRSHIWCLNVCKYIYTVVPARIYDCVCPYLEGVLIRLCSSVKYEELCVSLRWGSDGAHLHFILLSCGKLRHTVYVSACFVPVCACYHHRQGQRGGEIWSR